MKNTGYFISIEGIDGVGKTTQLQLLLDAFKKQNFTVSWTKQPGDVINGTRVGSNIGLQIRQMLFFEPTTKFLAPGVGDLLFLADALQTIAYDIEPALSRGEVIICDRYVDSQFAYSVQKTTPAWANETFRKAVKLWPDATILFTGTADQLLGRTKNRSGTESSKQDGKAWTAIQAQVDIQNAYLRNLSNHPRTIIINVDGKDITQVFNETWDKLMQRWEVVKANRIKDDRQMTIGV